MFLNPLIVKRLVKSGNLEFRYNPENFLYKYEVGYMETVQDVHNITNRPISGPYKSFRPILRLRNYERAIKEFTKLKSKI